MTEPTPGRGLTRREMLTMLGLGAGAAALAACAPPASPGAPATPGAAGTAAATGAGTPAAAAATAAPKRLADTVRMGRAVAPRGVDPHSGVTINHFLEPRQAFDALVSFDDAGQRIVPQLAASWNPVSPTVMEFKLRDDVRFSNGDPFTAETVKVNLDRVLDPANAAITGALRGRLSTVVGSEVVNSTTVRVQTRVPDPFLLNRLSMLFIGNDRQILQRPDEMNVNPLGTGSFAITEFVNLTHIQYEAVPNSWRGPSTVKSFRLIGIPEPAALVAALQSGEIDIAFETPAERSNDLVREFNRTIVKNDAASVIALRPVQAALQDVRVRQAFNYAVDKAALLQSVAGGIGRPVEGQLTDSSVEGYNDQVRAIGYDPERARSLVRAAGAGSADLVIETPTTLRVSAEAILGYLREAGINARLDILEPTVYIQRLQGTTQADAIHFQTHWWHLRTFSAAAFNLLRPTNPLFPNEALQAQYQAADVEMDQARRVASIRSMNQQLHDQAAALFLNYEDIPVVYTKKIASVPASYDRSIHVWKVEKEA